MALSDAAVPGTVDSLMTGRRAGCRPACWRMRFRPGAGQRRNAMAMDVVDYEIKGSEMQFVEVELDPGEAAVGEAGSMMFMGIGLWLDTVFAVRLEPKP